MFRDRLLKPAVFLDRDGVVIRDVNHLSCPEQVQLLPGVAAAIRLLKEAGYWVILITNQSAVARGYLTEDDLAQVHQSMQNLLAISDAKLDAIYYCPHHPTEGQGAYRRICDCRKPATGMIRRALEERRIDITESWLVGDKETDIELGVKVGLKSILVLTGYGEAHIVAVRESFPETLIAANLSAAVELVLRFNRRRQR